MVDLIERVKEMRQTHIEWIEHLAIYEECPDEAVAGNEKDHREAIETYDEILAHLTPTPERREE